MNFPEILPAPLRNLAQLEMGARFAALPPAFYTRLACTPLPDPYLICGSQSAADLIGLDSAEFQNPNFIAAFTGNLALPQFSPLAAFNETFAATMFAARSKLVSICRLPDTYALCQFKSV